MKKIFDFSALLFGLVMIGLVSCTPEELSTDQYSDETVALSAFGPNPVMRGAALTILGSNLDKVTEVQLPGIDPITEFDEVVAGAHGSLKVTVPVQAPDDAPVAGVVTIVDQNGKTYSSLTELTYTEAFKIDSFSPAEVHPGDVVTVKGDYLYNVKDVALYKDAENKAYGLDLKVTRTQLTFVVPDDATTGQFIISDVDHNNNEDGRIPNEIFSGNDLKILDPVVTPFKTAEFKSGQTVTITGEYLGMIEKVVFAGAEAEEFTVSEDKKTLTVVLPEKANDGEVTVVTYEGHSFKAGEITTVRPTGLAVAAETRYKAGLNAVVTGKDLDLVTGVKVAGVDATFTTTAEKTVVVIPAKSPDGDVELSLANGNTVKAGAIEVVKPVIESLSVATVVAGDSLIVKGTDLDLVTAVAISEQPCEFKLEDNDLKVYVSKAAFTGDLVLTAANECTSKAQIEVTYDESVSIEFVNSSLELGQELKLTGKNLMLIESVSIKGNKVSQFTKRTDDELSFILPEGVKSPGMYNLELVLVSGEALSWAVPFEVTAAYKLTPIWEGEFVCADWNGNQDLAWGGYDWTKIQAGTILQFTMTPTDPTAGWWCISLRVGDNWGALAGVPGQYDNPTVLEVELTEEIINDLIARNGLVLTGTGYTLTEVAIKEVVASEKVIWEGSFSNAGWAGNQDLAWGAFDWSTVSAGQVLSFYCTPNDPAAEWWCISLRVGTEWGALAGVPGQYDNPTVLKVELTQETIDHLKSQNGLVITGDGCTITKVTLL